MTWLAKITGRTGNNFPLHTTLEGETEAAAEAAATEYLDANAGMLIEHSVSIEEKPRFHNHIFNDIADMIYDRQDGEEGDRWTQEEIDHSIRAAGENNLFDHVAGLVTVIDDETINYRMKLEQENP